ncbi:acyl carrier protein [Faecalibaculum rodentium]|jgi:acyl carrier protein|uniref:acyl carrier protein n=1 Tax=Faecalibaculum rodentium TaxID=1702221 RepID=UPI0023F0A313|nr:acyl carrier protein [Faecalibaculum rodentium]
MLNKIKEVLTEALNTDPELVVPEARLAEDLEIDSLAAVELALELEDTFGIEISDEQLAGLKTVQDILDLVAAAKK